MLAHVPHSVAMGNATMRVKKHAAYTTSDVLDDGIYRALVILEYWRQKDEELYLMRPRTDAVHTLTRSGLV